ncbi:uncharacterized protein LOC127792096 [Diospyros lotus]|uniref:uncharacterized protein LOC127792096 n=1 Tax=Diospyros lotus TaxID=55363 RepID=UPI00224D13EF|nr:uncharacterized protein LOC127792096 [Diospyros lotus]
MAALELLLSQARRHCFTKTNSYKQLSLRLRSPLLGFHRSLCSSSSPEPSPPAETRPDKSPRRSQPPPVQAVSYPVKPKEPSPPQEDPPQSSPPQPPSRAREPRRSDSDKPETRSWTREDIRYVKDIPKVSPVSYPSRVAPLPEDRAAEAEEEGKEEVRVENLEKERKRIEADTRRRIRWDFRAEEEKVPFPTLIKQVSKKEKVIYDLQEAVRLIKANAKSSFNETVEIHVNLAAELRRTDLKLDGMASLPHGTGKAVKIAVFAEGSAADEARAAGADIVGSVELIEGIKNGSVKVDFDICITTHQFVQRLQKLGNVLRSRMPSTKAGTVTDNVAKTVKEAKRVVKINKKDKAAVVHAGIGKVSFTEEALCENVGAFVNALLLAKPAGLKKSSKYAGYVNSVHLCSTMGPGFPVSIQSLSLAADRYHKLQLN